MNTRLIFGPFAIVAGLALSVLGLWILLGPTKYQASTQLQIEPDALSDAPTFSPAGSYDPYFFEMELKAMVSEMVLSNVVATLNLNTEWSKRYDRKLEATETVELLRPRIDIRAERNTKLVEIRVTDEDPNEAAKIANAIAEAYKDYRISKREQEMAAGIKIVEEDCVKEEAKISLMQSNLDVLNKQFFINHNPYNSGPTLTLEEQPRLKEWHIEFEAEYLKMNNEYAELQSMQATNPAMLREVLPVMSGDDKLPDLLHKLDDNVQKLAAETNGVGGTNSDHAALQASIADLNKQIDARVKGIMITLKVRVDGAKTKLDVINEALKEVEVGGQPYWKAKDELNHEKDVLELLKAKIEADKRDDAIPKASLVVCVNPAVPPTAPSSPNRKLGAVLLTSGLLTSGFGFYSLRKTSIREEIDAKPV